VTKAQQPTGGDKIPTGGDKIPLTGGVGDKSGK